MIIWNRIGTSNSVDLNIHDICLNNYVIKVINNEMDGCKTKRVCEGVF